MKFSFILLIWFTCSVQFACTENESSDDSGSGSEAMDPVAQKEAVIQVIQEYESSLNTGSVEEILSLFATDAIIFPEGREPAIGKDHLQEYYSYVFDVYSEFNISMDIQQVDCFDGSATVWTLNSVSGTLSGTGEDVNLHSRSLIFLTKGEDDNWYIYQYMFNNGSE
jgi:uncharacterized protein (TIGR02246 family)